MATLEQIQAKMKRLQLQADALISKKTHAAVNQIRALMLEHGLTTADIDAHTDTTMGGAKRGPKPGATRAGKSAVTAAKKPAASAKGKLPPKYINHKTGETWSGHARPPAWIADVKDRTKFLIAGGANTRVATSADAVSKAKGATKKASVAAGTTAHKGQQKGPQPAKYRDPKSGATWSGRGRAPDWLASLKDRTRFLIDSAEVTPPSAPATKKSPMKTAPAKKTATKTAAVLNKAISKHGGTVVKRVSAKKATTPAGKKAAAKKPGAPAVKNATAKKKLTKAARAAGNVVAADVAAVPMLA